MKNYLKNIKKIDFTLKFILFFEKIKQIDLKSFKTIIVIYSLIFSIFLFLSIPGLYNYKNYHEKIKKETYSSFKLKLDNITEVKYRFVPKPHILIEEANLNFDKGTNNNFAKLKNIKIYISIMDLYRKDKISIKELNVNKGNFYFKKNTISFFKEHLDKTIIKPIKITNSNFFYLSKNDEVANIVPIKELKYFIDYKIKEKNLKIKGKLFDVSFNYIWKKNYNNPNIVESSIDLVNPNINLSNKTVKNFENNINEGLLKMIFLNNKLNINYKNIKNKISFLTDKNNLDTNYKIKLNGNIALNPFYFNTNVSLSNIDFYSLVDKFLPYLYNYRDSIHSNINGISSFTLLNTKNKLLENILMSFKFANQKMLIDKFNIKIKKIGNLTISDLGYLDKEDEVYVKSKIVFNILDSKQFYYRFQVPKKNRINLKQINFDLEKNLDKKVYYISNIKINSYEKDLENETSDIFDETEIFNIQTLKKLINDYLASINQG
tara:strand:- start:2091 stop:3563 length:1473 start_codon:yes stop_codon:yes gene_type:complete